MKFNKWKYLLKVLLTPNCWMPNGVYSEELDRWIHDCIDAGYSFKVQDKYYATLNGVKFWIANHPYASFNARMTSGEELRPSLKTVLFLGELIKDDLKEVNKPKLPQITPKKVQAGDGAAGTVTVLKYVEP